MKKTLYEMTMLDLSREKYTLDDIEGLLIYNDKEDNYMKFGADEFLDIAVKIEFDFSYDYDSLDFNTSSFMFTYLLMKDGATFKAVPSSLAYFEFWVRYPVIVEAGRHLTIDDLIVRDDFEHSGVRYKK